MVDLPPRCASVRLYLSFQTGYTCEASRIMKLPTILFVLLLALCALFGLTFVIEEVPFEDVATPSGQIERVYSGHGVTHPRFPTMDHGGSGGERHARVLWLGWAFGVLQIALIVGCLMLGVKRDRRVGLWLVGCGVLLGAIFSMVVVSYQSSLGGAPPSLFFSLPGPTAWFLYGYWPAQFVVVALYVLVFNRAVITTKDVVRFHEIVAAERRRRGDE